MAERLISQLNERVISPGFYYQEGANRSELFRFRNGVGIFALLDKLDSALVMFETRLRWSESFRSRQLRIPEAKDDDKVTLLFEGFISALCFLPEKLWVDILSLL